MNGMPHPRLLELARDQEAAFMTVLRHLVEHESPSHDKAACDRLAAQLATRLERDGWEVERRPRTEVGDLVVGRRAGTDASDGTLILAHYDTVWPVGTLKEMPFSRDGDRIAGPGVLDMKGGIAIALLAVRLAAAEGVLRGPVTLLATSDEETGSVHSRAAIEAEAREHARVLVVEPGRDDGAIKVGRKGVADLQFALHGVSAHAGLDPAAGASALRELARLLLFAEDLGDAVAGTTVNLTVASGGTANNVIAERATARIDVRVANLAEGERVVAALRDYQPHDQRVRVDVTGGLNRPPLESTPANAALLAEARARAAALGLHLTEAVVGGGSDGNFTSAAGLATLDGLGPVGGGAHARHEHLRLEETLQRVALVASLLQASP